MCTTSVAAYSFALGLCAEYEEKLRKQEAKAPRRPELKQKSKEKDKADAGPSRKVADIDYEKHEDTVKELELQEKQEAFARKQLEAANRPPNMGCSHDHQKEWAIYEKPFEEKIAGADRFRIEGNEAYNKQNYGLAAVHYRKALLQFDYTIPETPEEEKQVDEVKIKCLLNLAACKCQQEEWDEVLIQCRLALEIDPNSVKAYYRTAQAHLARDNFELAKDSLLSALDIAPKDPAVVELLKKLKHKMASYKTRTKEVYTTMVTQSAGVEPSQAEPAEPVKAEQADVEEAVPTTDKVPSIGTAQETVEEVETTEAAVAAASATMQPLLEHLDAAINGEAPQGNTVAPVEADIKEDADTTECDPAVSDHHKHEDQDLDGHEAVMQLLRQAGIEKLIRCILPLVGILLVVLVALLMISHGGQDL